MDRLRVISFSAGGRPIVELDLNDGTIFSLVRDTFKVTPGPGAQIQSRSSKRYAGSRVVGESHDNGSVEAEWYINPNSTADGSLQQMERLFASITDPTPGRYVEWRPEGATYSTYFELRGPGGFEPMYRWIEFQQRKTLHVKGAFLTGPLALGDRMDIWDDFSVNSLSDYAQIGATGLSVDTTNKVLVVNQTAAATLIHNARGYQFVDGQITMKVVPGSGFAGAWAGRVYVRADAAGANGLFAEVAGTTFRLGKRIAGVDSTLGSTTAVTALTTGTAYWLRIRVEGRKLTAEWFTSEPTPMATPANTRTFTLTSADLDGVAGFGGLLVDPVTADSTYTVDDFKVEPFSYRAIAVPDTISLQGTIPGTAPALVDATISTGTPAPTSAPIWAMLGWVQDLGANNRVWNGDFEDDVDGWSVAAVTNLIAAGTSVVFANTAGVAKFGAGYGQVTVPGVAANEGVAFRLGGSFRAGVTYTASIWVKSTTGATNNVQVRFGNAAAADTVLGSAVAVTANWQQLSVAWTPTADRDHAYIAVLLPVAAAAAKVFVTDGAMVYEGITPPVLQHQIEGKGGSAVFGMVEAEAADPSELQGWAIAADAASRGGSRLIDTAAAQTDVYFASWLVDPNIVNPDDFTAGDVSVEVWARVYVANTLVTPKLIVSARPEDGLNFGAERFSDEFGAVGRVLTVPTAGTVARFVRLGTVQMYSTRKRPRRWRLVVQGSVGLGSSGNFGIDYLVLVPARNRILSPTGKPNDSSFPKFISSTSPTSKTISSDLSGWLAAPPKDPFPDHGLGGTQTLEFPPGLPIDALVKLSSLVPDNPTIDATTEDLNTMVALHFAVWPRYRIGRA